MQDEAWELEHGAQQLGLELGQADQKRLVSFLDLVDQWNPSAGITTIPRKDAVRLHLLDSLAVSPLLGGAKRVADLGSGGGFPGIPLAIVNPETQFLLVDSNRRRASFLSHVKRHFSLDNVEVLRSDVKEVRGEPFDLVLSRAFRDPAVFVGLASPLLSPGGFLIVMVSGRTSQEIEDFCGSCQVELDGCSQFTLPGGSEARTILRVRPLEL